MPPKTNLVVPVSQESSCSDDGENIQNYYKDFISLKHFKGSNPGNIQETLGLLKYYNRSSYLAYVNTIRNEPEQDLSFQNNDYQQLKSLIKLPDNLCFYGYGSKKRIIEYIRSKYFSNSFCWEVKGYLPTISIKKIYNNFGNFLKEAGVASSFSKITLRDQYLEYYEALEEYSKRSDSKTLIVFFHCLDGQNLTNIQHQRQLSLLFSLPKIRLISSIYNVKLALIWGPSVKQNYGFLFYKTNTNLLNIDQQSYRPNPTDQTDRSQQSLMGIYQGLTGNQKRILKILAKNELENCNRQIPYHFTSGELLQTCIDEVILSSDTQLRQNLLDLIDHKVIEEKMDELRMKNILIMKYQKKLLQKILDYKIE